MKFYVSATALIIAMAGSSLAADLPSVQAPAYTSPSPLTWTGIYGGLNAGGAISESGSINASGPLYGTAFAPGGAGPFFATVSAFGASGSASQGSNGGFVGGGQLGYGYQFAAGAHEYAWVVGLETDFQGVGGSSGAGNIVSAFPLSGPINFTPLGGVPDTLATGIVTTARVDYVGTVRGRLGFLVTPTLLVFGTGGLAYGGANASTSILQVNNDLANFGAPPALIPAAVSRGRYADTQVGWAAGGGLEWMVLPNWSAKVEYLYADLGSAAYSLSPLVTGTIGGAFPIYAIAASQTTVSFREHIVRTGVNYHFNFTAPAPVF